MSWFKAAMYGIVLVFFTWVYGLLVGGDLHQLTPYLFSGLYLLAGLVMGLMNYSREEIATAFRDAGAVGVPAERRALAREIFANLGIYPAVAAGAGTILQGIWALSELDMPQLPIGLAGALLPLWLALGFRFFLIYPFEVALAKHPQPEEA